MSRCSHLAIRDCFLDSHCPKASPNRSFQRDWLRLQFLMVNLRRFLSVSLSFHYPQGLMERLNLSAKMSRCLPRGILGLLYSMHLGYQCLKVNFRPCFQDCRSHQGPLIQAIRPVSQTYH